MTIASFFTLLLLAALAGIMASIARRARLWNKGKKAVGEKIRWSSLMTIPKRYFVDLHNVVARDSYIAYSHIAVAGGAVAALLLLVVVYIGGIMNLFLSLARLLFWRSVCWAGSWFLSAESASRRGFQAASGIWFLMPFSLFHPVLYCLC